MANRDNGVNKSGNIFIEQSQANITSDISMLEKNPGLPSNYEDLTPQLYDETFQNTTSQKASLTVDDIFETT